ncbi:ABC transporter ATP-binding protein/permease [Bacillus shivajii]|uniref:ABC transporter ATP-binding protein n=1 Tax=Bacillus shivajii TaxID=1983719 RepID=UPI001CFAF0E6|nr:ABC transporter ATP-binding protein [Bacillus shivajii]UCZ53960.1 ABC transporter ATP-binding protein/permease [Bacillus shivajii]
MKRVFSFLGPYKLPVFIALFLTLIELGVELVQPLIMARIIDDGVLAGDMSVVLMWGGILVSFALIAFAAGITNSFYAAHVSQNTGFDLRSKLFGKVQSFSFSNFTEHPTSSLITRMTHDVTQIQNTIFMSLRIMLRAPLLVIGSVIMALIVNWQLALILAISVPLLVGFLIWVMSKAGRLFKAVQQKLDKVNGVVQENLMGIRLIKAFLRRHHEGKRFTNESEDLRNRTVSALRVIETTMPIILLVMNVSIIGVLWFGTVNLNTGGASVGEIVAIVNYITRMTGVLSVFSMIVMIFSRAKASAERISDVLETEVDLVDGKGALSKHSNEGKITFDSVNFKYPGTTTPVLQNISFEAKPGERIALLGATGSGKTSLFQLIPRLYDVDDGKIYFDHTDISTMKLDDLRKRIGYVPQEALLFTGSIKENISWGKENATLEEIQEAAKHAQIHETVDGLPDQYETILGQRGVNLSGGQKQRISIARALVRKPSVLLLDDSTSALDVKTEAKLLDALKQYQCTTLMITQKMSTTMRADTILLLENGEIIAKGNHEELLQHSDLYQQIYESQFGKEKVHDV